MTFGATTWAFVIAVAIHNLEEAIWLPAWSQSAQVWHRAVTTFEFRFAAVVLTVLAAATAALANLQGKGGAGAYLVTGYALTVLLNVVFPWSARGGVPSIFAARATKATSV
jgi:heme/copper-type cytochrome/quinol oxidase subunit 3